MNESSAYDPGPGSYAIVSPGHDSSNAASSIPPVSFQQSLHNVCISNEYILGYDYKITKAAADLTTGLRVYTTGSSSSHATFVTGPSLAWTTYEDYSKFDKGSEPNANAFFLFADNYEETSYATVLFDNAVTYAVSPPKLKAGAEKALVNGGFESGELAPWQNAPDEGKVSIVKPGLDRSAYAIQASSNSIIRRTVTLTPGSHYLFTLQYNMTRDIQPGGNFFQLGLNTCSGAQSAEGDYPISSFYSYQDITEKGPGSYSRRMVAQAAEVTISPVFFYNLGYDGYPVIIDNLNLKEIEKPSTS